jgi:ATP-dependent Lhr-like helicase
MADVTPNIDPLPLLPERFDAWFKSRGWAAREHQLALAQLAEQGRSVLLTAPTGGGKTLAGFLPSLIDLAGQGDDPLPGLHTIYISPLKALSVDVARNLEAPAAEMALPISIETRTGDTPQSKRVRQRRKPPHILLTTPESLALLLSYADAPRMFGKLQAVIIDELHALADNKRGEMLALGLARLTALAPNHRRVGLSATVADPPALTQWLSKTAGREDDVSLVVGEAGAQPEISVVHAKARVPWSGHMAMHAMPDVYEALKTAESAIVFVNTRAQAELAFQALWRLNEDHLAIALHHGSLAVEQRRKVEAAMAAGKLRAVVATSSLDLGIDWGNVDLVIQVGAPKGAARLLQRIGRANHQLDAPSRALLTPGNRFELLECRAAIEAAEAGELDGDSYENGGLDVLAQHLVGVGCSMPFDADALYAETISAAPYADLSRADFDAVLTFAATGGYALKAYERYHRLTQNEDGLWRVAEPRIARQWRMNVGVIVDAPMLKVRVGRRTIGEVEEAFANGLEIGDSFRFSGLLLEFTGVRETTLMAKHGKGDQPKVPIYGGARLPLTTRLARRVREILSDPKRWSGLPDDVLEWLRMQRWRSELPKADGLLVETFPRGGKYYLVAYSFEGRNAHQTLGMLLTRRMARMGYGPLGFVATDYVIAVWSVKEAMDIEALFAEDLLGDDLEEWMAESTLLKRTFRNVAVIAGLIERRHPGQEKSGRQVTVNSDLIYDVLRRYEPDHILLRATERDAAKGLTDVRRLGEMLARASGKTIVRRLARVSPLAVPVLLEIGKEFVYGDVDEALLADAEEDAAEALIEEAMAMGQEDQAALPL